MADERDDKAAAEAEKAYAAAASEAPADPAPVAAETAVPAPAAAVAPKPAAAPKTTAEAAAPRPKAKAAPKPAASHKAPAAVAKPKTAKPVKKAAAEKVAPVKAPKPAAIRKPAKRGPSVQASKAAKPTIQELKEKIMANTSTTKTPTYKKVFDDMTAKATAAANDAKKMAAAAAADAQAKTKEALLKGGAVAAEVGEFSKGNVQAVLASSKILASGVKAMSQDYVLESKDAFDTLTSDLKAIAAVKTPAELFQLQGKIARRNFDSAVALSSKASESLMKLANEAFLPISSRVSLAVDKFSKAA